MKIKFGPFYNCDNQASVYADGKEMGLAFRHRKDGRVYRYVAFLYGDLYGREGDNWEAEEHVCGEHPNRAKARLRKRISRELSEALR